jgi:hypothetical protein
VQLLSADQLTMRYPGGVLALEGLTVQLEPGLIGLLGRASNGNKPSLYYELRLNGQPINPATKFSDLG